jgi:hypothetical protein
MADSVTVKQHDTWPPLKGIASDENGAVDLSGATDITLVLKTGGTVVSGSCDAISPADGDGNNWQYTWQSGDTDMAGTYQGELQVTWDTGEVETFPNDSYFTVIVMADLGP